MRDDDVYLKDNGVPDSVSGASFVKYAVIVAGGCGRRAGGEVPKQFQMLRGRPMLWWSMKAFMDEDESVSLVLVLHKDYQELWHRMFQALPPSERFAHEIAAGGETRYHSVKNGLSLIPEHRDAFVAVHDAARPMIAPQVIRRGWKASAGNNCGAVPVVPVTDSLRLLSDNSSRAVDRTRFAAVQTPQIFPLALLRNAYRKPFSPLFTDDASVAEAAGVKCILYPGDTRNVKVTNPGDIAIAELIMSR